MPLRACLQASLLRCLSECLLRCPAAELCDFRCVSEDNKRDLLCPIFFLCLWSAPLSGRVRRMTSHKILINVMCEWAPEPCRCLEWWMSVPFESCLWRWKFLLVLTGESGDTKPEPLLLQLTTLIVPPVINLLGKIATQVNFFWRNGLAIRFWTSISFKRFVSTASRPLKEATIKRPAHLHLTIANISWGYLERKHICWVVFVYPPATNSRGSASLGLYLKVGISLEGWLPSLPINQMLSTLSFERLQLFRNTLSQSCHPVSLSSQRFKSVNGLELGPLRLTDPMLCSLTASNLYSERYQNSYSTQSFLF